MQPTGVIDWWCAPRFDSPPLLWSLLDPAGPSAQWMGARVVDVDNTPAGPTAHTVVRLAGASVELWDGLVTIGAGSALVRLVRTSGGVPVDACHRLSAGGFDGPAATWPGPRSECLHDTIVVVGAGRHDGQGQQLSTRLAVDEEWTGFAILCGTDVTPGVHDLVELLGAAETEAAQHLSRTRLPKHHPERAADAIRVLRACTYSSTGAVVASPTTSLPESPGADRQFDYRYTWLRDAALAVSVASLLGRHATARTYLQFLHGCVDGDGLPAGPLVDVAGRPVPEERDVNGVEGWSGSRPVRVGNGAAGQVQYDALGMVVEAISVHVQTGGSLDHPTWAMVQAIANHATSSPDRPTSGIWELRDERRLVSADIGRWLALDRAIWIARGWRPLTPRRHWKARRAELRDRVLASMANDRLPQSYDDESPKADASALMAVIFGLLSRRDPRSALLVEALIADLGAGPFLYRYEPGGDDGFDGVEGAFLPTSWWAVSALAAVGKVDQAMARADALCRVLPRLLPEEIDPATLAGLGNVPLVWSHAEAARACYLLDAADRRRRHGVAGLWAWRLARYLKLRKSS